MGALTTGCGTCKKRKVKCDNTRPECIRCQKAGIVCTGFAQRLRYVDENPRIRRSIELSEAQSREFTTALSRTTLSVRPSSPNCQSQRSSPVPLPSITLPLTAFKDNIFFSYMLSKLFEVKCQDSMCINALPVVEARCGIPADWAPKLIGTPREPGQKSWDALAALLFGQAHKCSDLISEAHRLYGQALVELRSTLSSPNTGTTDSTLASMTALYTYELQVSATERGWMSHANGLGWLLESRGPWQQKPFAGKYIFLEHRIMLVAKSIVSHQKTFLRDELWKRVPWEDDLASKTALDYLLDIGTDITEYIAQIHTVDSNNWQPKYSRLRTQITASLEELNAWWRLWEANHTESVKEVPSHQSSTGPLFATCLEYDKMVRVFEICIYDAIRILLLQLWHMLPLESVSASIETANKDVILDVPNGNLLLGITSDIKSLAREILRSLEYAYRKSQHFISTFGFLFVQDVAYCCFDRNSKEALWLVKHGWCSDREDAYLLKRLLPPGQIKAGDISKNDLAGSV